MPSRMQLIKHIRRKSSLSNADICHIVVEPTTLKGVDMSQPPHIPTKIYDLTGSVPKQVHANTRAPIEFENDNFEGRFLIKLRTDPVDPYYAPYFEKGRRVFEIQAQGRCKNITNDEFVYMGVETTEAVKMGRMAKVLSALVFKLLNTLVPGAHATAGCDELGEVGHVVMPLVSTVDRLVITPPGEEPPTLGVDMLPEPLSKAERSKISEYSNDVTYSLSMHQMYVDFVNWKLCQIPGMGEKSLKYFLGDLPIRLVCYTLPKTYKGPHTQDVKKYMFNFDLVPPPSR